MGRRRTGAAGEPRMAGGDRKARGHVGSHERKPLFQGFLTLLRKRTNPSQVSSFALRSPELGLETDN